MKNRSIPSLAWQRGVAAVEFGLLLIPLVTLAFGITEYGRAVYQYNTMVKGVRAAVRYLTEFAPGDTNAISAAQCLAAFGNTACSGQSLVPNLLKIDVTVQDSSTTPSQALQSIPGGGTANLVTVSITGYQFHPLVTLVAPPTITFNTISATMIQL